jgi:hypothetical protein
MKRYLIGAVFGAVLAAVGVANASLTPFTGAQDPSQIYGYLNTLIAAINNQFGSYITFQNGGEAGELQITGTGTAFAQNASVATGMTSIGPVGSHTTVQEWLIVVNPSGYLRYIPAF